MAWRQEKKAFSNASSFSLGRDAAGPSLPSFEFGGAALLSSGGESLSRDPPSSDKAREGTRGREGGCL